MESGCSSRHSAANMLVQRRLEEILGIHFPQNNHAVIETLMNSASCSERRAIDGLRLVSEFSKQFMRADTMEDNKIKLQGSNQDEKMSLLNNSRRKVCRNPYKGKELFQASVVGQLIERLRILEDETEILKPEFYEHTEDRRKLVNKIFQQFETIQSGLEHRNI